MNKTVILIHGSHHGSWCWDNFKNKLENTKYEVISYELLGHGKKTDNNIYTIKEYAEDLKIFLNEKKEIVIIAHSLGCLITYYYLIYNNKNNVIKVFFLAPAISFVFSNFSFKLLYNLIINGNFGNNLNDIRESLFSEFTEETIIKECYNKLEKKNHTNFINSIIFMFNYKLINKIPIYLIAGEYDNLISPKTVRNIRYLFENNFYKCFPKSGHNLMMEHNWCEVFKYIENNIK